MNPQYLVIEVLVYIISLLVIRHAWRVSRQRLAELFMGMLYGLLLEMLTMRQAKNYHYGRFAIMITDVPLAIGMGWGLIIYSAVATSDYLALPVPVRPLLDTLLALHIDLNMDPVANRIGMWVYGSGGAWFDVPYGNYFGWFTAVIFFSAWARYLRQRSWAKSALSRLLIIPLALICLGITNQLLLLYLARGYPDGVLVWTLVGLSILIVAANMARARFDHVPDLLVLAIPFLFQVYFVTLIFVNGYFRTVPSLAPVAIIVWVIGLLAYSLPSWGYWWKHLAGLLALRKGTENV